MKVIIDGVKYYPEGKPHPKPLLADAKVGDLCQRRDGKWVRLSDVIGNSVFKYPNLESNDEFCQFICDETGDTKRWGKIDEADIIHTEHLAPEGSAEWAGQMLKLGKKVIHGYNEYAHHLGQDGKVYYGNINKDCQGWLQEWVNGRTKQTGWKLYNPKPAKEPEQPFAKVKVGDWVTDGMLEKPEPITKSYVCPVCNVTIIAEQERLGHDRYDADLCSDLLSARVGDHMRSSHDTCDAPSSESATQADLSIANATQPQYKVGDWVEIDYKGTLYHRQVISVHDNGIRVKFVGATPILSFDGKNNMVSMRLVRKLDPSKVVVDFGSFKGRVRKNVYSDGSLDESCFNVLYDIDDDSQYIEVDYAALTNPATADLVRELIAKQGENNG